MSFSEWSNKKKKKASSFSEWSNAKYGISEEEKNSALAPRDDEIAPVRDTANQERTWFKESKGGFWKTVGGTIADFGEDLIKGIGEMPENLLDFLTTLGTHIDNSSTYAEQTYKNIESLYAKQGKEVPKEYKEFYESEAQLQNNAAEFVAKDILKTDKIDFADEEYSILGDKSDSLVQSAGRLGVQLGMDMLLPGSGMALMGASAAGGETENALRQGATFDEASMSGAISAGAEMLTEKIGGVKFGGKTLTDALFGKLSSKMTTKLAKVLIATGKVTADALAEGGEEILSGYMSALGQKLTYMKDKEIEELFSKEDLLESFIGGAVLGGLGGTAEATIKGKGYVTGLNKNEQNVVDKVYNDTVAEKEKNGKKLTSKEKSEIYDNIVEQMDKGGIKIDTIEEVLGGKTFEEYKSVTEQEKTLTDEISQLENLPKEQITVKQSERLAEAREQLKNLANKDELKSKLGDEVYGLVKDSRLVESYNEKARKGQAFEADLSQYEGKQKEAVERAIKSGVLNNTNRSHELVNVLSKIEADKGIVFDYTNNEKLKESGFAIEGKTVNGFANKGKGTVTLNVQSAKAWQSTVGHEVTHILEGTDSYSALQEALFEYAESKGELESRRTALTKLYNGIEADIDAELTADLVGDYLFSDKDFINKLTGNRTLFQKVYDEIKYLCKVATGKELTQIEKVKQEFDKVWKDFSVNPKADTSVMTREEYDMWRVEELNRLNPQLSNTIKGEIVDGVYLDGESTDGMQNMVGSHYGSTIRRTKDAKVGTFTHEILHTIDMLSGYNVRSYVEDLANGKGFDNYNDLLNYLKTAREQGKFDGRTTNAEETAQMVLQAFYSDREGLRSVTPEFCAYLEEMGLDKYSHLAQNYDQYRASVKSKNEVADVGTKNVKYSVSADNNGNELSIAVQKRFANSKAVDENGNLKVLYHGTASGEFYTFDKSKGSVEGDFGSGFYFTDSESDVKRNYEGGGPDFENKIDRRAEQIELEEGIDYIKARKKAINELFKGSNKFKVYLNIENPAIVGETYLLDYDSFAEEYDRNDYDSDEDYESDVEYLIADKIDEIIWDIDRNVDIYSTDGIAEVLWNAINEGGIDIEQLKTKINELYLEDNNGNLVGNEVTRQIIESLGYDGIIDNTVSTKFNMDIEDGTTHYIVFKPNQIKSVDNQNPTDNPDIRFSLSRKPIISKLTEREISEQTYATLDKLQKGESVALEELESLPEVIEGSEKVKEFREEFLSAHPELKDVPSKELGTHLINTAEREQMRNRILQERLKSGSFTELDKDDKEVYNGSVEKGKRLDIVIGLPAAGKSTSIVLPLSQYYKSVVVDSDIIKQELPEFNEGWGASLVHEESSNINAELFDRFTQTGSNIVLPIVGSKTSSIESYINLAKAQGYDVHLHLNELNSSKAMGRMLRRYFSDGRFIPPSVSYKYGDKPTAVYEEMKNRSDISGYSHWNNDVAKGQRPTLTDISGSNRALVAYSRTWRASRATDIESSIGESSQGESATNQIAPIKGTSSVDGVFFDGEKRSLSNKGEQFAPVGNYSTPLNETALAPTREDISAMENADSADGEAPFFTDYDAPPVMEDTYYEDTDTTAIDDRALKDIAKTLKGVLSLNPQETKAIQEIVQKYSTSEIKNKDNLFEEIKAQFGEKTWSEKNEENAEVKRLLRDYKFKVNDKTKREMAYKHGTWSRFRKSYSGRINFSQDGLPVDVAYMELSSEYPAFFPSDIVNEADQLFQIADIADMNIRQNYSQPLSDETIQEAVDVISAEVSAYKQNLTQMAAEETAKEALDSIAPDKATQLVNGTRGEALLHQSLDNFPIKTVEDVVTEKIRAVEGELADNQQLRREAEKQYKDNIEKLADEYMSKKRFDTKVANNILQRISKLEKLKASVDAQYAKRISDLEARLEKMREPKYSTAMHKQAKMQEHADFAKNLLGDTSTWVDKKLGIQYEVNTEHRNFRDVIRDADGNKDIARADAINDALSGEYNRNEAEKKRTIAKVTKPFAEMKINEAETTYIQMLGELRHNPDTTLTEKVVKEYYEKHKNKIDTAKVDKAIEEGRKAYDTALELLNAKLREQGMKEIPYRKGYFHHYTEPKQNFIQKLLNWKVQDNDIPTSIAGLTEDFKPVKSWQPFDKQRHTDTTDYNFLKGLDNYLQGAYDWIYHLEDIQKRRAIENYIRSTHSDEGVQARIKEVYANEELDADEAQAQIEHILAEAKNPLNNFVQDFMTKTNILAGKKNSLDRVMEQKTNRKIYSIMTNVQNRMSANMVLANVRSALTNFIPITQSWAQVSPLRSLQATKDTIANAIKDDGLINKSTFLTNRLREADKLYQTNWDKVLDKAGIMFEIVDNFSSQVIWRSKYNQNLSKGMTESEAIKNADQFAENVMAGRSKGNEPTLFNAKNPLVKAFTMFQLEVNNQYGYFFKDVPNDLKTETNHWKLNLAKGYTTAFIGAYVYNALMEKVAGSGAALDPIGIIEDLLRDLGLFDDDEEKELDETLLNLGENVVEELPFVGGLFGGGRIPISSALPYSDDGIKGAIEDVTEGNWKNIGKEMMNPLLNVGLPVGGGQIKKTYQGLNMFNTDEEHPIAGSYTDSGNLRFPVEDTLGNRIQAGIFGQYASENAREYFDNGYAPLKEKQIQEYADVDLPIGDYWKYRDGLKGLKTNAEKADYINSLDVADWQKNLLMNNILDRKEDVDMSNYDDYGSYEEFDYAQKNPEKYAFAKSVGGYDSYKTYSDALYDIKADKDANGKTITGSRKEKVLNYINNLDADYETKIILFKSEYPSDDTYNYEIIEYINNRNDLTYEERITIYTKLGFTVKDGYVYWD